MAKGKRGSAPPGKRQAGARLAADPAGTYRKAVELHQAGRLDEAQKLYAAVLTQRPGHADALHYLGVIAYQRGGHAAAIRIIGEALKLEPRNYIAHTNLGIAYQRLDQPAEALASFDRALALQPDHLEALNNRGLVLWQLGRLTESLESYDRALALKPDCAEALGRRGLTLHSLGRLDEALATYDRSLALQPGNAEALSNRGITLQQLNRVDESLACFETALAANPDYAPAHWNQALSRLLMGDLARGWPEAEWRWLIPARLKTRRQFQQPLWLGKESLDGKTVLLHAEQGLGDTLQFARYVPRVAGLGARVLLEVQPSLRELLAPLPGVDQIVSAGEPLPAFDMHCPLLSLPLAFNTGLSSIPASPSYLAADPGATERWQARLGHTPRTRIGLVWSGSTYHPGDHQRSIPLHALTRLQTPDLEFISLQRDVRATDQPVLDAHPAIRHFGGELEDFAATAALMACLDLVISVDTAPAHLAGALGKPVWILLPFAPDWRWMLNRDDSPWYPSARLFRQPTIGDWDTVIDRVAQELQRRT